MKVTVVLPAYNAERTLEATINDLPFACIDEVILVDDASRDGTIALAHKISTEHPYLFPDTAIAREGGRQVPFVITSLPQNCGYGGNQKRCYDLAISRGAEIVIMVHPDFQYDPSFVQYMAAILRAGHFHVMLGSRIRSRKEAREGGMPAYKYYANRALTLIGNIATGRNLSEWHTGLRAYRREVLEAVSYNKFSNDFIFDVQMLRQIIEHNFSIGDISVPVRYFDEVSSINFSRSVRYGLLTLWEIFSYAIHRALAARVFHYGLAGALGFASNIGLYIVLLNVFGAWYIIASVVAFLSGAVVSFSLQKFFTFKENSFNTIPRQLLLYGTLLLCNVVANTALLAFMVTALGVGEVWGAVFSNAVVACWSFFMYRRFVFSKQ